MRFAGKARNVLAVAGLATALLTVGGPALASAATPSPAPPSEQAPSDDKPRETEPRPLPEGAPETGGGPGANLLAPAGGVLLVAGAGTGLLVLRRRKHTAA
ncbi:hypothetical protein DP939_23480 [Spongiactinospora rosea]|uniref:Gram-positive cocci surface proteins LPxTG domain-containing protein n=1 Tax=Spongiactinospora rosea TaxID=2248750 RepID=A0A366LWX9_9ACTN|nr:hypothetical protein [Spongiactinospora rosea]RBQ17824.1 hypothetical protein DP939_23480 [Spongiactinospora rosea]